MYRLFVYCWHACRSSAAAVLCFLLENAVRRDPVSTEARISHPFSSYGSLWKYTSSAIHTTSNVTGVLQRKLSHNFPLMKSAMTSSRRSNSQKNNLRRKKRTASVEETRELKSCRGMWQVHENHIKWLVMSVFLSGAGNAHLVGATRPAFGEQGAKVTHFTQAFHFTTTKGGCNPGNLF